jgi:D-beta-D-heptose 7-phosphate kinase/D-beta-D-heptose 1-phosphate adenosyltransferase
MSRPAADFFGIVGGADGGVCCRFGFAADCILRPLLAIAPGPSAPNSPGKLLELLEFIPSVMFHTLLPRSLGKIFPRARKNVGIFPISIYDLVCHRGCIKFILGSAMLREILSSIRGINVLVVGDIMLDHYVIGDATRISPEAPVPVVAVERESYTLGASANVALNVLSLGGNVELCGAIGGDEAGTQLRGIFNERGIKFSERFAKPSLGTIVKTRVVVRGQQLCRVDREQKKAAYILQSDSDLGYVESKIGESDAIILSDYNKGTLSGENVGRLINCARRQRKFIAMDPKPSNGIVFSGVDAMTPNKLEAMQLAGLSEEEEPSIGEICQKIHRKYSPRMLIITLGQGGMLLSMGGEVDRIVPTFAREVYDVSGAGDTVIAALTMALAANKGVYDAMYFANTAAGVVVGKRGTAVARPEEILEFHG